MNTDTADPFATPGPAPQQRSFVPPYAGPPTGRPPMGPPPGAPPVPWWQRDGVVSRILVLTGVGVTLVGVVMVLVLAAQQGLLIPEVRVGGGVLLSLALLAAGWRVMDRPGGRVGGTALLGTGFAGLYLDILAATTFYDWLPPVSGLMLALAVAAAGAATAMRWSAQLLAAIVTIGCAVLAPVLTEGVNLTLVAFLIVFAVVGAIPELLRGWWALAPIRTIPVVLAAAVVLVTSGQQVQPVELVIASVLILVGLGSGLVAARRRPQDVVAVVTMAMTFIPALQIGTRLDTMQGTVWSLALAAIAVGAGVVARPLAGPARVGITIIAVLCLLQATTVLSVGLDSGLPFLGLALVLLATDLTARDALVHGLGQMALVLGATLLATDVTVTMLIDEQAAAGIPATAVLAGLAAIVAAVIGGIAAQRCRPLAELRSFLLLVDALVGLYAANVAAVAMGVTALPGRDGFNLGQFLATASYMIVATWLVQFGLRRPAYAKVALTSGLTVAALALSKLFLFDLAAMGGVARAGAFLVVGLLLLVVGTRYARSFADRAPQQVPRHS